jgi:hypothetical protein
MRQLSTCQRPDAAGQYRQNSDLRYETAGMLCEQAVKLGQSLGNLGFPFLRFIAFGRTYPSAGTIKESTHSDQANAIGLEAFDLVPQHSYDAGDWSCDRLFARRISLSLPQTYAERCRRGVNRSPQLVSCVSKLLWRHGRDLPSEVSRRHIAPSGRIRQEGIMDQTRQLLWLAYCALQLAPFTAMRALVRRRVRT